jgi:dihydroflavonol-4-reductase
MNLITGATGMVGAYLMLQLLESNEKVVAIFRSEKTKKNVISLFELHQQTELFEKIIWEKCDLLDIYLMTELFKKYNFENIYNCAALISFDPKDFDKMIKTNVEGTANLVNFALENKVKQLCHVSSIAALGDIENNETVVNETSVWNKELYHSNYSISKYGSEIEVWRAHQEGLNVVVVNPGVILGACFWNTGSGKLFDGLKKSKNFYTNGFTGFVAVEDLVKIMVELMQKNYNGENFIVVSENISYKKLNELINGSIPKYYINPMITNVLYRIDWLFSKLFFIKRKFPKSLHISLHSKTFYSNDKVKNALNFNFEKVDSIIARIMEKYATSKK